MNDSARDRTDEAPLDALVIGAGFNGVYQLHRLREAGFRVRLFEAGSELGGVWHANRYPGARVDSHLPDYAFSMPEVWRDWSWSERFPEAPELVRYFRHVARVLDLERHVRFGARVVAARFDAGERLWHVRCADGSGARTRYLLPCLGFASRAYTPDIPGLASFGGQAVHTAHWPERGVDLRHKRVGIVGTGASGVQVFQEAVPQAAHVTLFQRTPVFALAMQQRAFDAAANARMKATLPEVYARRARSATSFSDVMPDPRSALAVPEPERNAIFEAAWQRGGFHFWAGTFADVLSHPASNALAYAFWRAKVLARVRDPRKAELLAPAVQPYPFGAKRPSLEQTYYDLFDRDEVDLVDLRATPITHVTREGVHTAAGLHALDVLVLATGFDASTGGFAAIDLHGTHGRTLAEVWAQGVVTHLGMAVPGFPNMLMLYGPHSPTAFCNGPTCAELQGDWVVECLRALRADGHTRIEATDAAAAAWKAHMREAFAHSLLHQADSWYVGANIPGKPRELLYYANTQKYLAQCRACTAEGYSGFLRD